MLRISRQAVYQYAGRQHKQRVDEESVIHQVRLIRHRMPRIGTRKLYERLEPTLEPLGIGRDGLFEILRHHRLLVRPRKRFIPTTNSRHRLPVQPNLLKLTTPDGPGRVIVADQTYLRLNRGFCYLSLASDLYSQNSRRGRQSDTGDSWTSSGAHDGTSGHQAPRLVYPSL